MHRRGIILLNRREAEARRNRRHRKLRRTLICNEGRIRITYIMLRHTHPTGTHPTHTTHRERVDQRGLRGSMDGHITIARLAVPRIRKENVTRAL